MTHVTDAQFNSGDATWMLNGEKIGTKWRQQIGKDAYPVWTGNYLVNHSEEKGYYNETMCEKENGIHSFIKEEVKNVIIRLLSIGTVANVAMILLMRTGQRKRRMPINPAISLNMLWE